MLVLLLKQNHEYTVQFSSVASDSLWPYEPQHARPPCPSPTPGGHPNPCPLSQWCHPTISSSVVPFSSCPQSFPALGSFPISQLFASGGQNIGASASVLQMNIQGLFPLGLTGLISLLSKGLWRVFSNTTVQRHRFFGTQPFLLYKEIINFPILLWKKMMARMLTTCFLGAHYWWKIPILSQRVLTLKPPSHVSAF